MSNLDRAREATQKADELQESFRRTNNYLHRDQSLVELNRAAQYAAVAQAEAMWDIADTLGRIVDGDDVLRIDDGKP